MTPSPLAEVAADPDSLEDVPREELAGLLAELEQLRAKIWARLTSPPELPEGTPADRGPDQLLDAEAVAEVLGVDPRYVYDHADDWPFTRRISPRKLRFSQRGLYRWLETRS